jgi:hypothetical protein
MQALHKNYLKTQLCPKITENHLFLSQKWDKCNKKDMKRKKRRE